MKILLWSDVHCHLHRPFARYVDGMNSRLRDGLRIIDQVTELANDCDMTMFLGDLFHVPAPPAPAFNQVYDRIRKLGKVCPTLLIAGNHDLRSKYYGGDPRDIPFLKFRRFTGIDIAEVDVSTTVELDNGMKVLAFNHRRESDAAALIKDADPHDILVMHQEVYDVENEFGRAFRGGLHPEELKEKFRWVFTGHIHKPQILNERVVVVGASLHIDFGDVGDRGVFILDTEKDDVEVVDTTFPRFVTLPPGAERPDDDNFYRPATTKEKKTEALKIPGWQDAIAVYCEKQEKPEYVEAGRKIAESAPKDVVSPQPFSLKNVDIENFGVFSKAKYDVDAGLHMVVGEVLNIDGRSNGAGKTTLFESISWAIYGKTSKKLRGASVMKRDRKRGKVCKVVVTFDSPRGELKIERTQKANGSTLEAWLGDHHEHGRVPDTQEWITNTLGVDYEFFQQMVYFSQEQAQFFSEMGDADRKKILGTLLGTRWYEAAEQEAKDQRAAAKETIGQLDSDLAHGEETVVDLRRELEAEREAVDGWEEKHLKEVTDFQEELNGVLDDLADAKVGVDDKRKAIEQAKAKDLADADSGHRKARERTDASEEERVGEVNAKFDERAKSIKGEISSTRKKIDLYDSKEDLVEEKAGYDHNLEELREREKEQVATIASLKATAAQLKKQGDPIRAKMVSIKNLEPGVRCSTCGAEVTKDSQQSCLKELTGELNEVSALVEQTAVKLATAAEALEITKNETKRFEEESSSTATAIEVVTRLGARLDTLKAEEEGLEASRKAELAEVKAEFESERSSLARDKEALLARIEKRYSTQLADLERDQASRVSRLEERAKQARAALDKMQKEENPHVAAKDRAEAAVSKREKENNALRKQMELETAVMDRCNFWVHGFGREGIRAALLSDFCRVFTGEVNDILTQMGIGMSAELSPAKELKSKKGEVRDQLDYQIRTTVGDMAYQELSGGEKVRIDLASMLALNLIASRHFGIEDGLFGILVLDEIFSSLDEAGVEVVYQIINGFTARSIYAISHDPSMKSMFLKVLTVLRDGTESVLIT